MEMRQYTGRPDKQQALYRRRQDGSCPGTQQADRARGGTTNEDKHGGSEQLQSPVGDKSAHSPTEVGKAGHLTVRVVVPRRIFRRIRADTQQHEDHAYKNEKTQQLTHSSSHNKHVPNAPRLRDL